MQDLINQINDLSRSEKEEILRELIQMVGIDLERILLDLISNTIEPKIFDLLPNDPNEISVLVENKLNDLFDSLTKEKESKNQQVNKDLIKLEAYQILKNEILNKMPTDKINVYGMILPSVREIISKVLSDRVSEKAMDNVITPAKITGKSVATKGFAKIITPYAILTFLGGALSGVLLYKFVKRNK